jgi:hypothetical protein
MSNSNAKEQVASGPFKEPRRQRIAANRRTHEEVVSATQDDYCYEYDVTATDIPDIVAQLWATGKHSSFAVLMFSPPSPRKLHDPVVNLQYSMEGAVVGLDWVLLGPRNCDDKARLVEFITQSGHTVMELEMNEVAYLRVEGNDIANLGTRIVTDFYHVAASATLGLLVSWFPYRPRKKNKGNASCDPGIPHRSVDASI